MGPRVGRNKAAIQGACHNFALHWLAMILKDSLGSAKDRMTTLAAGAGGANPLLQKVFGERWKGEGADEADLLMLKIHGLTTKDAIPYGAYDLAALKRKLTPVYSQAFIYSFWFAGSIVGAEGGAHSVAFFCVQHNVTTAIHFFDPNFGEFLMTLQEFDGFWQELVATYGSMKNHWLREAFASAATGIGGR